MVVLDRLLDALMTIEGALRDMDVDWALGGSMGLALQGLSLEPNDLDIVTDRPGAYDIQKALSEYSKVSVEHRTGENVRSFFGSLEIDGVKVEIMGELEVRGANGVWEPLTDLRASRQLVAPRGTPIPVLSLRSEHQSYLRLGRTERAEMILRHISQ